MATISPDRGLARLPATMLMCVSRDAGRQISSLTCRLAARGMGALRALRFRFAQIHCKKISTQRAQRTQRRSIEDLLPSVQVYQASVFLLCDLCVLCVKSFWKTILRKYPAREKYFLRLWGIRFFYWRISAASETTRSAIARHDVRPGDSIPIN